MDLKKTRKTNCTAFTTKFFSYFIQMKISVGNFYHYYRKYLPKLLTQMEEIISQRSLKGDSCTC